MTLAGIRYATYDTSVGRLLAAATMRGLCALYLGDDDASLVRDLRAQFPDTALERVSAEDPDLGSWVAAVQGHLRGEGTRLAMPIDLHGTPFQQRVWAALREIPSGETRTYQEIADAIGVPGAVRAVASACARNRVAIVVPCHRVVRTDGGVGGYRWHPDRKRALLEAELSATLLSP